MRPPWTARTWSRPESATCASPASKSPPAELVKQTIEKLGGEYLKGLIIDLRDNPGGAVQSAAETAALFLSPDQLIFTIGGRSTKPEQVAVPKDAMPYTFPVAILINGKSASASEIVTGALQDHDRAIVLGEPSYGKGLGPAGLSRCRRPAAWR